MVHPHVRAPKGRLDEVRRWAQHDTIRSLTARLEASQQRIWDLENCLGVDKRALVDEIARLRLTLRQINEDWEPKKKAAYKLPA